MKELASTPAPIMTTPLNPRTKRIIKESIEEFLYVPARKQTRRQIEELIVKNCRLQRTTHKSFVYKTVDYNMDSDPIPLRRNRLVAELRPTMEECLADEQRLIDEMPLVMGVVVIVLNASNAPGDWLCIFPASTHHTLKKAVMAAGIELDWYHTHLPEATINELRTKHQHLLDLMRQRMTINLLIS